MILVDSSVWIHKLRNRDIEVVRKLDAIDPGQETILVGDLILMEVLAGARDEHQAARIERQMRRFQCVSLLQAPIAGLAAAHYRTLRSLGITVRTGIDMLIGTFCLHNGHKLLHDDRDFLHMERHLGLQAL